VDDAAVRIVSECGRMLLVSLSAPERVQHYPRGAQESHYVQYAENDQHDCDGEFHAEADADGMTRSKRIIAAPTGRCDGVAHPPEIAPINAAARFVALISDDGGHRDDVSGSVAWRIPRKNPTARMGVGRSFQFAISNFQITTALRDSVRRWRESRNSLPCPFSGLFGGKL